MDNPKYRVQIRNMRFGKPEIAGDEGEVLQFMSNQRKSHEDEVACVTIVQERATGHIAVPSKFSSFHR